MSYLNMCTKKRMYRSEQAAHRAGILTEQRLKVPMRIYKCPNCVFYHLTTKYVTKGL